MRYVILPQAFRASIPPLANVQIALLKNTTVAGALGVAEAFVRMRGLLNDYATARTAIFHHVRGDLRDPRRGAVLRRTPDRTKGPSGMSGSVLFEPPGRGRSPDTDLRGLASLGLLAVLAYAVLRLQQNDQFEYQKWEPFLSPTYINTILVNGVLETLKMAFTAILLAVAFGVFSGSASSRSTAGCAGRAGRLWSSGGPCRCC